MARATYLAVMLTTLAAAGGVFYTQSGAFSLDHASFFGSSLLPLVVAIVALIGCFAPFDRPRSAPLWAAPLVGLAIGLLVVGLLMFTVSFAYLALPLAGYALVLGRAARRVAAQAPPPPWSEEEEEDDDEDDDGEDEPLQESWLNLSPSTRSYGALVEDPGPTAWTPWIVALSAAVGGLAVVAWLPPPGEVRPLALDAEVAPVISAPSVSLNTRRVQRAERWVEAHGANVEVRALVGRPHVSAKLGDLEVAVEPCLYVEEATVDGFFAIPGLNTARLEPAGPAISHYAEAPRHVGGRYGWIELTYRSGRVALAPGARWAQPLSRLDASGLSARLELDVDLDDGWVCIDAQTRLERPLTVHRATFAWIKVLGLESPALTVGMVGGTRLHPPSGPDPERVEFVMDDGDVGRVLRSRVGTQGPYEVIQQGELEGWWTVGSGSDRLLIVAPDWSAQVSLADSRGTGHGLRENALVYWVEGDALKLVFDLAGTRLGVGRLSVEYPPGVYRNRMWLRRLLPHEDAAAIAQQGLRRLGASRSH